MFPLTRVLKLQTQGTAPNIVFRKILPQYWVQSRPRRNVVKGAPERIKLIPSNLTVSQEKTLKYLKKSKNPRHKNVNQKL